MMEILLRWTYSELHRNSYCNVLVKREIPYFPFASLWALARNDRVLMEY
jgi:hypothetical protein